MEALVTSVTRLAERLDAVDAARSRPATGAFASTSSSRPAVIQETAGADEEFSFMPRAPVTTSTTDLKQLSLPRRLLDGCRGRGPESIFTLGLPPVLWIVCKAVRLLST